MTNIRTSFRDSLIFSDLSGMPEPFPGETLLKDGWKYADCNGKLSPDVYRALISTFGAKGTDYRLLACSKKGEEWIRGQFLLSPGAVTRYEKQQGAGK